MTDGPNWASPDPQPERPPNQPPPNWAGQRSAAAKPGVIPLRPLGLGEILDGAISTMRAHPRPMLGVSAIVVAVTQLLILAATYPLLDDINRAVTFDQTTPPSEVLDYLGTSLGYLGIILLLTLLSRVFLSGFLTVVVGKAVLGQPTGIGEVWQRVRPRLLALLGLTMIYPAAVLAATAVVIVLILVLPVLGVVAAIAAIIVGIWLYILFSLATPALMLENATVGRAFGRSRHLVTGSWWRILGITLLAALIATVVALVITTPFTFLGGGFDQVLSSQPVAPSATELVLSTIGGIIAGTLTEPFAAAVTVLLYTDQRMRREGMDIELARAAGPPPPA